MLVFFFFKQKTAYEMRISDWSSDVCSSDLPPRRASPRARGARSRRRPADFAQDDARGNRAAIGRRAAAAPGRGTQRPSRRALDQLLSQAGLLDARPQGGAALRRE